MIIRVNSDLANPMLFRVAQLEGISLEVSHDIVGFSIEQDGEVTVTGTERREFHMAIRDIMRSVRSPVVPE